MKKTRSSFAAMCLVCAFSGPLRAAGTKDAEREARRAFQEAEAHFQAGEFAEALSAYETGYAQAPLPGFLINIAQCYRRLGDLTRARATYQKFVMVAPDSPHVPEVTNLIAEIDKLLAQLEEERKAAPAASTAATGDATLPLTPSLLPAPSPAPEPNLLAPAVASAPVAPVSPPPAAATGKTRWWLWGLAGAAVVVAGGTAAAFALGGGTSTVHQGSLGALRR